MAISIDWGNKVITVPKGEASVLTLVQSTPTTIYKLDTVLFKAALKGLEDGVVGIAYPRVLNHNKSVTVGGVQLAPVIEIINGYTITFDDTNSAPYAVNLSGSNNNIADVTNVNTVSVRPSNSAGLVQTSEIQYASFQNGVTIDAANGKAGTTFPAGTKESPVNNITDALFIANLRGFDTFYVRKNLSIVNEDVSNFTFIGDSQTKSLITIGTAATTTGCEFKEAAVTGTLDGNSAIQQCYIQPLNYVEGFITECLLSDFTITLGGASTAYFLNCWSSHPEGGLFPTIDMANGAMDLVMRNHSGPITIINKSDPNTVVSIDLQSGYVVLDSSVTAGNIIVRGVGYVIDNSVGATIDTSGLITPGSSGITIDQIERSLTKKLLALT